MVLVNGKDVLQPTFADSVGGVGIASNGGDLLVVWNDASQNYRGSIVRAATFTAAGTWTRATVIYTGSPRIDLPQSLNFIKGGKGAINVLFVDDKLNPSLTILTRNVNSGTRPFRQDTFVTFAGTYLSSAVGPDGSFDIGYIGSTPGRSDVVWYARSISHNLLTKRKLIPQSSGGGADGLQLARSGNHVYATWIVRGETDELKGAVSKDNGRTWVALATIREPNIRHMRSTIDPCGRLQLAYSSLVGPASVILRTATLNTNGWQLHSLFKGRTSYEPALYVEGNTVTIAATTITGGTKEVAKLQFATSSAISAR
jgi:hypothetical protein